MRKHDLTVATLLLMTASLTLVGCSDLSSQVTGQVFLDDKPLQVESDQRGLVVFRPVGGGPTTTGIIDGEGRYSLKTGSATGIKPGDYLVAVRIVQLQQDGAEGSAPSGLPITPAVYADPLHSGLTVSVKSGRFQHDLKLDSGAGPPQKVVMTDPEAELDVESEEGNDVAIVAEGEADKIPNGEVEEEQLDRKEQVPSDDDSENTKDSRDYRSDEYES